MNCVTKTPISKKPNGFESSTYVVIYNESIIRSVKDNREDAISFAYGLHRACLDTVHIIKVTVSLPGKESECICLFKCN